MAHIGKGHRFLQPHVPELQIGTGLRRHDSDCSSVDLDMLEPASSKKAKTEDLMILDPDLLGVLRKVCAIYAPERFTLETIESALTENGALCNKS